MKKTRAIILILASIGCLNFAQPEKQDEIVIWREFIGFLKNEALPPARIRPASPMTPASQMAVLRDFIKGADWEEWDTAPEIVRSGNLVSFLITLGAKKNSPWTYTFNFVIEDGQWYFRFLEGIVIRLDKVIALPADASGFPDRPEEGKNWMRSEVYWSEQVRLFNFLAREKGRKFAFRWVKEGIANGPGYALGAVTWIPFFPPPRSFILYLCWEQAKLGGDKVTLEELDDKHAVVRFEDLTYFALYMRASHLKQQISFEDYVKIFETIWQERAQAAGWSLFIDGQGRQIFLRFSR